ncbi:MAG TPA: SET domain-containing protein [Actinospica sp.]|nr:SET domain-containing protein [Actinospica sp.]
MRITPPDADCRLHPDVEVRTSAIEGKGLFARAPIRAGTAVSRLGGRLVSGAGLRAAFEAAARDPARPYIDTITVADDAHLILPPRRPNGYGNHSCDPNLWWIDAYTLAARRPIAADEELTNDYGTSTGVEFRMKCGCGSQLCRGVVTGEDWRRPELQARYGEHWIPFLLDRIRDLPPT